MSDESKSSRVADPDPLDLKHDRVLLSTREAEVVRRTQTKSYATVAEEMGIAESTVGTYRNRAKEKLTDQVKFARRLLRQQQADQQEENLKEITREAVESLRDCGVEVTFKIEPDSDDESGASAEKTTSAQQSQLTTATVDMTQGALGDDHEYTKRIRKYANEVVHGDDWALSDIDLSEVTFETRQQARKRHGVAEYDGGDSVTVGVSEETVKRADFDAVKDTVRHELVHVWQYQHRGETVELPNGTVIENVEVGHTGCWYEWKKLVDVQRTDDHYSRDPTEYNYRIWCASCGQFVAGRFRMCSTVRCHSEAHYGKGWCSECDHERTEGSTFVVTDDDDEFYDSKRDHPDW